MKTTSLMLSKIQVMSKLIEFLKDHHYKNTSINLTYGVITTELRISFFQKEKIQFAVKSPSENETQIEIIANRYHHHKITEDTVQEDELIKKLQDITGNEGWKE